MRLSTKARYAVMAMVDIASRKSMMEESEPVSLSAIAVRQNLPLAYLEQLFNKLKKADLVISARGSAGGYILKKAPMDINVFDIIAAVDTPLKATRCSNSKQDSSDAASDGCQMKGVRCLTHDLWDELSQVIELFFQRISLADICDHQVRGKGRFCLNTIVCASQSEIQGIHAP